MPVTQHAPPPIPLPRDDKPSSMPPHSPSYSTTTKAVDTKPIVSNQPARESPPPSTKPVPAPEPSKSSQSSSRSSPESEQPSPETEAEISEDDDIIDMETFDQILELDDSEDDREFSKGMVWAYFSQADDTFKDLDAALQDRDLGKLSDLGHFLKGSSAALGVRRVQAACEKIQHYGHLRDEDNDKALSQNEALALIRKTLVEVKKDYAVADKWLRKYYEPEEENDS